MPEFTGRIEVGYKTDNWGPYTFGFPITSTLTANDGLIPYGQTIASANVRAFVGKVTRKSTLSQETEITDLIDPSYSPTVEDGNKVKIKLQNPVAVSHKGSRATLIFEITLSPDGGTKSFYYQYVYIR